ncbi:MAG: Trm112 family protein [bacterium]
MPLKEWFLEIACCPRCGGRIQIKDVEEERDGDCIRGAVVCLSCQREYPIVDGIPVLHSENGRRISE